MYSAEINGEVTEFGTSGLLYRSNKLMYDHRTQTLWHQFRGEPVVGPLADSGIKLEVLPMTLTTWGNWSASHPDTTVLGNNTGVYSAEFYSPESDRSSLYFEYRNRKGVMFPVPVLDDQLAVKDQVFGLVVADSAKAYPAAVLAESQVLQDTVASLAVVIVTDDGGGGSRAYSAGSHIFQDTLDSQEDGQPVLLDQLGTEWLVLEDALVNSVDRSQRLERLPSRDSYWFGWYSFYPETELFGPQH